MTHKQCINNALQNKALFNKKAANNQHSKYAHIFRNKIRQQHQYSHILRIFILKHILRRVEECLFLCYKLLLYQCLRVVTNLYLRKKPFGIGIAPYAKHTT
jgi:hypothetical protein